MLDILFAITMVAAIVKGFRKGLVIAVFSMLAFIIGLAAALKLSAIVAVYLQHNVSVPGKWLPFISFALVFIVVVMLVNLGGKLIERTFEMVLLGWANKLGGILLYAVLYTIIFSIFLFFTEKIQLFPKATLQQSIVYPFVQPWGAKSIEGIAMLLPIFKNSFTQLEDFFLFVANKL